MKSTIMRPSKQLIFAVIITFLVSTSVTYYFAELSFKSEIESSREYQEQLGEDLADLKYRMNQASMDLDLIRINHSKKLEAVEYFADGEKLFLLARTNMNNGDYSRELFSYYYASAYYDFAIQSCEGARDTYAVAAKNYQDAKTTFEKAYDNVPYIHKNDAEALGYYINASDIGIDMAWALYETCEYHESASNYYAQGTYESGDAQLETGNERIRKHDRLVLEFNEYISKITLLKGE